MLRRRANGGKSDFRQTGHAPSRLMHALRRWTTRARSTAGGSHCAHLHGTRGREAAVVNAGGCRCPLPAKASGCLAAKNCRRRKRSTPPQLATSSRRPHGHGHADGRQRGMRNAGTLTASIPLFSIAAIILRGDMPAKQHICKGWIKCYSSFYPISCLSINVSIQFITIRHVVRVDIQLRFFQITERHPCLLEVGRR